MLPEVTHTVETPEPPAARRDATVMELAAVIAGSRDFPDCRTPEKAAVRILAGREMGVGPIASVIGIRVQAGRVSMDATLMAGCIKRSGRYDYKITSLDNAACALVFFENGEPVGESVFSMADAKTAGLAGKDTWKSYPRNMMFARALSNGARWYCAGIFGGSIYTHEELGYAVDEEGRAVEGEPGKGNELCTREQRQTIAKLVEALGTSMPGYLAETGIKLLDELSQQEAAKEIKKLEKKLLKAGLPMGTVNAMPAGLIDAKPASATPALSPAQATLADAIDESKKPSTPGQRDAILGLAGWLIKDENELREAVKGWLTKRHCSKLADLNHLQASALIEGLQTKIAEAKAAADKTPPFDPDPAKLPGM